MQKESLKNNKNSIRYSQNKIRIKSGIEIKTENEKSFLSDRVLRGML